MSGCADLTSLEEVNQVVTAAISYFNQIDILVNCVGIQREQPLMEVTEDVFDEMYRTNLRSAMFLAQAVARHQIALGEGGRQIHLLSVRSRLAF